MEQCKLVFRCVWPVLMLFLPSWVFNLARLSSASEAVWNPLALALQWTDSVPALLSYSPAYGGGALGVLAVCLAWHVIYPSVLYAALLFFAACMAGPTWTEVVRSWYYLAS